MRLVILPALAAFASPAAAAAQSTEVSFPMLVERAEVAQGPVASGGVLLRQKLRSTKAVRLGAPVTVPLEAPRRRARNAPRTAVLPAGTVAVAARGPSGEMYCAVAGDGSTSAIPFMAGVCFRDADGDGSFDRFFASPSRGGVRTPYEIDAMPPDAMWSAAATPYTAAEAPPPAELGLTYQVAQLRGLASLLGPGRTVWVSLCWPEELVLPYGKKAERRLCGVPAGAPKYRSGSIESVGAVDVAAKAGGPPQSAKLGPVSITLSAGADGKVTATGAAPLPEGPVSVSRTAVWMSMTASVGEFTITPVGR